MALCGMLFGVCEAEGYPNRESGLDWFFLYVLWFDTLLFLVYRSILFIGTYIF